MSGILQAFAYGRAFTSAPVNTVAPAVTGTAQVRNTLSCSTGTWTGLPAPTYTYQWQRVTTNISGATSSTYTVVAADVGSTLRCVVTATNSVAAVSANSNSTAAATANVPTAPTIGTATATGLTTATVSYTAPSDNGGATITSYTATSSPGGITGSLTTAGSGTIAISGLTSGTTYTFTVKATNSVGQSAASAASNSITTASAQMFATLEGIRYPYKTVQMDSSGYSYTFFYDGATSANILAVYNTTARSFVYQKSTTVQISNALTVNSGGTVMIMAGANRTWKVSSITTNPSTDWGYYYYVNADGSQGLKTNVDCNIAASYGVSYGADGRTYSGGYFNYPYLKTFVKAGYLAVQATTGALSGVLGFGPTDFNGGVAQTEVRGVVALSTAWQVAAIIKRSSGGAPIGATVGIFDMNAGTQLNSASACRVHNFNGGSSTNSWYPNNLVFSSAANLYYVAGETGSGYAYLAAFNTSGVAQWVRQIGTGASPYSGKSVAVDSSGNVYVYGSNFSTTGYLFKLNSSGTVQWQRSITDVNYASSDAVSGSMAVSGNIITLAYYLPDTNRSCTSTLPIDGSRTGTLGAIAVAASSYTVSTITFSTATDAFTLGSVSNGASGTVAANWGFCNYTSSVTSV